MTARLQEPRDGSVPIAVDLAEPGEWKSQLAMARQLAQMIRAIPMNEMLRILYESETEARCIDSSPVRASDIRADREVIEVLAFAQRKLAAIHARSDEARL